MGSRMAAADLAATMWSLEGPGYNVVSNLDDLPRGEMGGFNVRKVGKIRELFPRLSQRDYETIKLSQLPEVEGGLDQLLDGLGPIPRGLRDTLSGTRRLVTQVLPDGTQRCVVVPAATKILSEIEVLDEEQGYNELGEYVVPTPEQLAQRTKKRTYALNQLFDDGDASNKYEFPYRVIETARRMSVNDPASAAVFLQDFMNAQQDVIAVKVTAPKGPFNKSLAASTLRTVGARYERTDVAIESLVTMDRFMMFGPGGENDWHVSGPLKYASEVSFVYWMMHHAGRVIPNVLFSIELVLLGIEVFDGETCMEPQLEFHAGSLGVDVASGLSGEATVNLTAAQRAELSRFLERLSPVVASDGSQIATAVQVTGRHAIVNSHVLSVDPTCTLHGMMVQVKQQLARDVLSVLSLKDVAPWNLRDPVVGESVVVCYVVGDVLSCSAPIGLVSVTEDTLVMSMDSSVGPGVSGGAIVALSDLSLLGIHSGATRANLLAYRFGDRQFSDLLESDSVSGISRVEDPAVFAGKVSAYMKQRGLGGVFSSAVDALEPVFVDGMHVGMAVRSGSDLYTACDANKPLRLGANRSALVFSKVQRTGLYVAQDDTKNHAPVHRRPPSYYEKVFVIGFDDAPYLSMETEVAHIAPNYSSFVLRDITTLDRTLAGGIVMAYDGAVLGMCGSRSHHTAVGLGFTCWPLPVVQAGAPSPRDVLASTFPFLNLPAWPDELLDEVFVHSSVGKYQSGRQFNAGCKPLANIGDNVLKSLLWNEFRAVAYPHALWSGRLQELQSNANMSEIAWRVGLAKCIVVGPGTEMPRASKAYADMLEALFGAASLVERPEVVRTLAMSVKLIETPQTYPLVTRSYFDADVVVHGTPRTGSLSELSEPMTPAVE